MNVWAIRIWAYFTVPTHDGANTKTTTDHARTMSYVHFALKWIAQKFPAILLLGAKAIPSVHLTSSFVSCLLACLLDYRVTFPSSQFAYILELASSSEPIPTTVRVRYGALEESPPSKLFPLFSFYACYSGE